MANPAVPASEVNAVLSELLRTQLLPGVRKVAGVCEDPTVARVGFMAVPDIGPWLRHGQLLITTPEEAETMFYPEVYDVADLVICRDSKGQLWDDYDTLTDAIMVTVEPNSWDSVGGPGSIAGDTYASAKVLVVSQTRDVHREIAELLEKIRGMMQKNGAKEPPLREQGYSGGFSILGTPPQPQDNPPRQPQDSPGTQSGTFK